jgi:pyruvate-formate lyase-activating enzyme
LCTTTRGDHALCCQAQQRLTPTQDWREWWNGPEINLRRQQMAQGEWPRECAACEQAEQQGRGSLRESYWHNYPRESTEQAIATWRHTGRAPDPVSLDLAVGNTCNLKCRQCNAEWSSAIAAEQGVKVARPQAAQEWYATLPREPLHTIKVQGGEPMLQPRLWRWLRSIQRPELTRFEMVTNGTRDPVPYRDAMMRFRERIIFVSVDAVGERAEQLRRGTVWAQLVQNVTEFQSWPETYTALMCCVYRDNIEDIAELCEWARTHKLDVIWNILQEPDHLSLAHVPAAVRERLPMDKLPREVRLALDA